MIDRSTKLRWRRRFRRSRRQVEDLGQQAEEQLERHLMKRISRLAQVRRFVVTWVFLLTLLGGGVIFQIQALSGYYQHLQPAPGGTFTEGVLGSFTNANPLYATGAVDSAVSRLVFAGLMRYDQSNQLVTDLAENWTVDEKGTVYTITLRKNLAWHDGKPLTANDVVFTYQVIQNADAKSPLASSWQGVKIEALDDRTVVFSLPNALIAFPYSLTNGIVPRHLLEGIPMSQLRSVNFNTLRPIGSGPFRWDAIEVIGSTPEDREQRIALLAYENYHLGKPKLNRFVVRSFHDEKRMLASFKGRELNSMAGLSILPDELKNDGSLYDYNIPFTGQVMVFLKNSVEALQDFRVRRALTVATDTNEVIRGLGYPVIPSYEPLLIDHLGYDRQFTQFGYNPEEAVRILNEAGWLIGENGIRIKDGKPLTLQLYSQNTGEYTYVSQVLQRQWRAVGVDVQVLLQPDSDIQTAIASHKYDVLLYGIALGVDPDVFPYWHSSQADPRAPKRLNFSEYKSVVADRALEGGRTDRKSVV